MSDSTAASRSDSSRYAARRRRQIAYGRWNPKRDAKQVREHVDKLRQHGMTLPDIAVTARRVSGHPISLATVRALVYGRGNGTAPTTWLRPATAEALLLVDASAGLAERLTQARVLSDALGVHGWSAADVRALIGTPLPRQDQDELDGTVVRLLVELIACEWGDGLPTQDRRLRRAGLVLRAIFRDPSGVGTRRVIARALRDERIALPVPRIASLLEVSERTVHRDLSLSRA